MAILYTLVARTDKTVLARRAMCVGNFTEITELVLAKLQVEINPRMSLKSGDYLYHYLTSSQDLIFLCITDEDFDRSMAFHYLDELKRKFESLFTANQAKAAPPFGLNNEFSAIIEEETNVANDRASSRSSEKMDRLRDEVQQVKDIMVANIDSIVERGEKMELLVDKTEQLSNESVTFRQRARVVQRRMWWQNTRMKVILAAVIIVIVYAVVSAGCGGLTWPNCV